MKSTKNLLLVLILPVVLLATGLNSAALANGRNEKPDSTAVLSAPLPQIEQHGIVNITELGIGFGLGDTEPDFSRIVFSVTTVFDYEISAKFIAGVGTGVNFYNGGTMIPLYIDARYYFNELKTTPFIVLDFGEMLSLENISHSGLFVSPMVGARRVIEDKYTLNLSLGGLVQKAPDGVRNSFICFKAGLTFRIK